MAETEATAVPPGAAHRRASGDRTEGPATQEDQILSTYGWIDKKSRRRAHPDRPRDGAATRARISRAQGGRARNEVLASLRPFAECCWSVRCRVRRVRAGADRLRPAASAQRRHRPENGRAGSARSAFHRRIRGAPSRCASTPESPSILALVYYQCPSLCNLVLNGVVRSVRGLKLTAGERFRGGRRQLRSARNSGMAAAKKATYRKGIRPARRANGAGTF